MLGPERRETERRRPERCGPERRRPERREPERREPKLSGADLNGAKLGGANLRDADLREANLNGANLSGANLNGKDLTNANLSGVNLSGVNLSGAFLARVCYGDATRWPRDFKPLPPECSPPAPNEGALVVLSKGDQTSSGLCFHTSCAYVKVELFNFAPGSCWTFDLDSDMGPFDAPHKVCTDGKGYGFTNKWCTTASRTPTYTPPSKVQQPRCCDGE